MEMTMVNDTVQGSDRGASGLCSFAPDALNDYLFSVIRSGDICQLLQFLRAHGDGCLEWKKRSNGMLPIFYAASIGACEMVRVLHEYRPDITLRMHRGKTLWETAFYGTASSGDMRKVLGLCAYLEDRDALEAVYSGHVPDHGVVVPFRMPQGGRTYPG
jgi:hypothetical protein